jgi:hypothetical protein
MTAKDFDRLKVELGLAARKKIRVEDSRAAAYEMG